MTAIEKLTELKKYQFPSDVFAFDEAIEALEQQLKKTKGKWIESDKEDEFGFTWFKCSECGWEDTLKSNFCPNCGADMRGDK